MSYFFQSIPGNKGAIKTIVATACIVGVVDGLAAILLTYGLHGRPPMLVFQYIASGLLGTAAFSGGFLTTSIGVICHFFIALVWTLIFFFLHPALSRVLPNKILKCILYGAIIWVVMNQVVLPLSHVRRGSFDITQAILGITILIFAAGLPMVLSFDRYYFKR